MTSLNRVRRLHSIVFVVLQANEQHGKYHAMMAFGVDAHTIAVFFVVIFFSIRLRKANNGGVLLLQ